MKTSLEFITSGSEVNRYHTMITLQKETVGHHSHGVACLVLALNPEASRELLIAALYHDLAEQYTGDIPSPAKRDYGIGDQVSDLEKRLVKEAGLHWPTLTTAEQRVLKLADIAHGALFCVREMSLGNKRMYEVYDRFMSYATHMWLTPEEQPLFLSIEEMAHECK